MTILAVAIYILQMPPLTSAAIDAADDDPDEDIPGAEECDDTVETVVGSVPPLLLMDHLLLGLLCLYHHHII